VSIRIIIVSIKHVVAFMTFLLTMSDPCRGPFWTSPGTCMSCWELGDSVTSLGTVFRAWKPWHETKYELLGLGTCAMVLLVIPMVIMRI
jgi:hypothetical protein